MKKLKIKKGYIAGLLTLFLAAAGLHVASAYATNVIDPAEPCTLTLSVPKGEEYTEELKSSHLGAENALSVTVDGKDYGVYYASGLSVSVPKNAAYTVSGDNSGGFVVTYEKGE